MKYVPRLALLIWVWLAACLPPASAQFTPSPPPPIVKKIAIRYVGPPPVSDQFILSNIRVKVGEAFSRGAADEDVKNLYLTGYFFKIQVGAEDDAGGSGGVDVIYIVQGKPILTDIKIVGNKQMSTKKLMKKVTSRVGQPLDERKLFDDAQAVKELYEKAGYQKTTVTALAPVVDESAGRGTATIEVHETPKIKIKDIIFVNATAATQRQLRKVFKNTRRRWMFSWLTGSGVLKEDGFEDDKDALVDFYQNKGYIDFAIQDVKFDYLNSKWMIIRVILSEGRQYKIGSLEFKGNTLYTTNDFIKGVRINKIPMRIKLVPGGIFTPADFNTDVQTLRDMYGAKGYLDPESHGTTIIKPTYFANPTTSTMDLSYDIQEGEKCSIEKIIIKGNSKTKDRVLRRELAVYPGEVYNMVLIKLSKQKLEGLDYFSKVDADPEDSDVPTQKNLVIGVEEKGTGNLSLGAGFDFDEGLVGTVEIRQGNFDLFNPPTFTGAGQKLQLRLSIGTLLQDYDLNFIEPWFMGKRLKFGVDLFHRQVYYNALHGDYYEQFDGGTISLTKELWNQFLTGTINYTAQNVHLGITPGYEPYETTNALATTSGYYEQETYTGPQVSTNILAERGTFFESKVGVSLDYNTENNWRNPNAGQETSISAQVATPPGDINFYKLELRTAWFFKGFATNHVVQVSARTGVVSPWGDTDHIPIYERYFLGGMYSLRGYRYETVGPLDNLGEALGGDTYWFGSVEYTIPIVSILSYSLFYDIGNVYPDSFSFSPGPGRQFFDDDLGAGLRIVLPIGGGTPLRLDYGVPIIHDPTASRFGRFNFGIGYTRQF